MIMMNGRINEQINLYTLLFNFEMKRVKKQLQQFEYNIYFNNFK